MAAEGESWRKWDLMDLIPGPKFSSKSGGFSLQTQRGRDFCATLILPQFPHTPSVKQCHLELRNGNWVSSVPMKNCKGRWDVTIEVLVFKGWNHLLKIQSLELFGSLTLFPLAWELGIEFLIFRSVPPDLPLCLAASFMHSIFALPNSVDKPLSPLTTFTLSPLSAQEETS